MSIVSNGSVVAAPSSKAERTTTVVDENAGLEEIPPCSFSNLTAIMTRSMENAFYRLGLVIGHNPWWTVSLTAVVCVLLTTGNILWRTVTDDDILWTPYGSKFTDDKQWIETTFPKDTRAETVIFSGSNVLQAGHIKFLSEVTQAVGQCTTSDGAHGYQDLCIRDPTSDDMNVCLTQGILNIWGNNATVIASLSDDQVLDDVNQALHNDVNFSLRSLLSGLTFDDETGNVTGASAALNVFLIRNNGTKSSNGQASVDKVAKDWEKCFIEVVVGDDVPGGAPHGAALNAIAERSFDDEIDEILKGNFLILLIGCTLIVMYIAMVLGRLNLVEQRILLSFVGLLVILMSVGASYGLCFFMQIFFADMHPIIPFLLLGVGVDDMFIIVQSLENLSPEEKALPIPHKIALTMKHAGVAITVTSLTDMGAFLIAASSRLPILRHFCVFSAMGVLLLYFFAATFFVGCLTLDERRIAKRKVCPCVPAMSGSWRPNRFSQYDFGKLAMDRVVARYILKPPLKLLVLAVTMGMVGIGIYGVTQIEVDYNPVWYMRDSSYQKKFYASLNNLFPDYGEKVSVFIGKIKYWEHTDALLKMDVTMEDSHYVKNNSVNYWFHKFYQTYCIPDDTFPEFVFYDAFMGDDSGGDPDCSDELYFKRALLMFLNENRHFYPDFKFNVSLQDSDHGDLLAGRFEILASRGNFQHKFLPNTTIQNIAMDEIKGNMAGVVFEGESFDTPIVYSFMYIQWEANKLISLELVRNLSLTLGTIAVVTLFLVANVRVALLVLLCVLMSVTNVAGYAHLMSLTIEMVTSVTLILSCGLALDYAAHVGVSYVCRRESDRNERARKSMVSMGSAVFHGGCSTYIAFSLLIFSDSYIFLTFYKMFAMVVLFGLFHGLIFLPVALSLIGPTSGAQKSSDGDAENQKKS